MKPRTCFHFFKFQTQFWCALSTNMTKFHENHIYHNIFVSEILAKKQWTAYIFLEKWGSETIVTTT